MIDLTVNPRGLEGAIRRARARGIVIPTFAQQIAPQSTPASITSRLGAVGLWDVDPVNLFRINWHNAPRHEAPDFGPINVLEFPKALTGTEARIIALVGRWFPTGTHKVGAAFGCLAPRIVTGQFDPETQQAVWPSTGNYCRGGAYDATLLGCESIAILPEGMSEERFAWLAEVGSHIIRTRGTESNVKEIFDKCWELRRSGESLVILNQFEDFGNYLWHYAVTGSAMEDALQVALLQGGRYRGLVLTTGSAGTIGSGDYLKRRFPESKIAASEALQCPTLLLNGYGTHRIEGIGDKHVPWIHNVRNTDLVIAIDDAAPLALVRLFNSPAGRSHLANRGVDKDTIKSLHLLGISGAANLLSAIKFAKWYSLGAGDIVLTVLTDSIEMYHSRLRHMDAANGNLTRFQAAAIVERYLLGANTDHMQELDEQSRRRIHNLKYFTWVEQQGRSVDELDGQWESADYWSGVQRQLGAIDHLIREFNERVASAH